MGRGESEKVGERGEDSKVEGKREGREERRARGRGEEMGGGRKERREEREVEMRRRDIMWRTAELSIYSHAASGWSTIS